jgi:hypothetical protein
VPCPFVLHNPDNEFSTRDRKRISSKEFELGLNVDLIGGNGGRGMKEGIDRQEMPVQIERRKLLNASDDGFSQITGVEQNLVGQGKRQEFHVLADRGEEGQAMASQLLGAAEGLWEMRGKGALARAWMTEIS